jgi:hypothetical protein
MQILLSILLSLLIAWACAHHAKRRGRNPMVWLAAGAFFGLFALIALFLMPPKSLAKQHSPTPQAPTLPPLSPISSDHEDKLWYFLDDQKNQLGPMSLAALSEAWRNGKVQEQTYVWNETMENWERFHTVLKA